MRARSALAMATAIAALLVISAMPAPPSASLERHSATQLQGAIHGLLGRIADESPTGLAPGLLPALPMEGAPRDGNAHVLVHFLAGERSWAQWIPVHGAKAIDLDGDGTSELSVGVEGTTSRWLAVSGTSPADVAWAAWIEQDAAKWGVTGFGLSPSIRVGFSEGELLLAEHGLTGAWHAAFANVDKHQRALAWLHDPGFLRDFTAAVGLGYHVGIQQGGKGGIRLMLLDNEAKVPHDLTLRDAPTGAVIARDPDGALHYRAPTPGGALSSASDAAPIGQPGDLDVTAAPLPTSFTVQPRGPGFDVDSEEPTDLVLKWQPPAGAGVGIVGNGVRDLHVAPGAAGGLVVRGNEGRVAVSDLDSLGGPGAPVGGHVVDLGTEGALAVSQTSPITPAAVALMLGGVVLWAMRAKWNAGPKPA
jgi:hypothetical protein